MKRFGAIVAAHIPHKTGERLKVAVLDTGIDITHPHFDGEGRLKTRRSWVTSAADADSCGHGTHILSTILRLTRNVDVYVAKISEGKTVTTTDPIAEVCFARHHSSDGGWLTEIWWLSHQAIRVASEEWDVDFISMSFGFPQGYHAIHQEIEKAIYRGKTVFAAASNDGGNTDRAYPARQHGVICVHSTDGHGNPSLFNPTALDRKNNFCVVGENIKAGWPSPDPNKLGGTKYLSGTSFATPVAIAIAAFMVGLVCKSKPEHKNWMVPLKSTMGIEAIFQVMSERRNGKYDVVNPVKAFGGNSELEGQKLLLDIQKRLEWG